MQEQFLSIRQKELSSQQLDAIIQLKGQHWHYPYESQKNWIRKNLRQDDTHILLKIDNEYVAYLSICIINMKVNGENFVVKGLGNVCVASAKQKQGYGRKIVQNASNIIMQEKGIGVLLCHSHLVPFYENCGWTKANYKQAEINGGVFTDTIMLLNYDATDISCIEMDRVF